MVKYRKEFTNILDDCLDRILVRGESIEQCLQSYPSFARELEPLLKTALLTKKAAMVAPRPEFRERARYQFRAALQEMAAKKEKRGFVLSWQPRFATVAVSLVLALLIASSGTVAAANNSLPDSALYPVKLATEAVRLRMTTSPLAKAELHAKFADSRVAELVKMAEKGKPEQVAKVTRRLNRELMAMSMAAKANGEMGMMAGQEAPMMQAPMAVPAVPAPTITTEPVPTTTAKPSPLPRKVAPSTVEPGKVPSPAEKAPVAIAPASPSQPLSADQMSRMQQRAKLKVMMMHRANANPQAILEALQKAPDWMKPALYEALTVADSGYQQALEALDNDN